MRSGRGEHLRILGWGAFLANSWAWCIGLWLPVILARDYGPVSFLVFAFPNCLGAAAMGIVLRRPGDAGRLAECHRGAAGAFSFVTCAFQAFFIAWMLIPSNGESAAIAMAFVGVTVIVGLAARHEARLLRVSGLVFAASLGLLAWWLADDPWSAAPPQAVVDAVPDTRGLLFLTPVIVFGFLFSPYLDLTFLHARRECPGQAGSAAFVIGFTSFFFILILGAFMYASPTLAAAAFAGEPVSPRHLRWTLGVLIATQLGFTVAAHLGACRAIAPDTTADRPGSGWLARALPLALIAGGAAYLWSTRLSPGALSGPEVAYRAFMGFYGLVFPAYVYLCVIPRNGPVAAPTRRHMVVFALAVAAAAPFYYAGFILGAEVYLLPGVAVVLLARFLVPLRRVPPERLAPSPGPAGVPRGPDSLVARG